MRKLIICFLVAFTSSVIASNSKPVSYDIDVPTIDVNPITVYRPSKGVINTDENIDIQEQAVETEAISETVRDENIDIQTQVVENNEPEPTISIVVEEPKMSEDDINLIALVTMAEAEGESEYGKRLVIDTILNRVDSDCGYWPDTVSGVIYQKAQFTSMWNGRVKRCYVRDDIVQLVREELEKRTNTEVVYFRTGRYSSYGTPMFKEGRHYFSSLD